MARVRTERSDIGKARTPLPIGLVGVISEIEYNKMPANRRWELKNKYKNKVLRMALHSKYNLKKFGLTVEQYENMLISQRRVCAICRKPERIKNRAGMIKKLAVDHDHKTGKVRGLLCQSCNQMLGQAQDSIKVLKAGIEYLERYI